MATSIAMAALSIRIANSRPSHRRRGRLYIDLFRTSRQVHADDPAFIGRHLSSRPGTVLDLGCGPGHITGYLRSMGVDAQGIDMVPEFIAHAKAAHPGGEYQLGSMENLDVADHSVAGILSWYSTIRPVSRNVTTPVAASGGRAGPALTAAALSKRFGDRVAFRDVSFEIGYGEVFGFLGPNGAGKTTTVRTLGTLIAPTSGSATVAGVPLTPANGVEIRRRISIMACASGSPWPERCSATRRSCSSTSPRPVWIRPRPATSMS